MSAEIAARIKSVRFTAVRTGECYPVGAVDLVLDHLQAAALRGEPLQPLIEHLKLPVDRMREGYDIAEVDAFLAALRDGTPLPEAPPKAGLVARLFGRG